MQPIYTTQRTSAYRQSFDYINCPQLGRLEPVTAAPAAHRRVSDPLRPDGNGAFEVMKSETSCYTSLGSVTTLLASVNRM